VIQVTLTFEDGTVASVDARPFAIELWERNTSQKLFGLADGAGMGDLMRIAYEELKLCGKTTGKYDEWAATVRSVIEVDDPKVLEQEATPPA
jgi:hypothetical protein